MSVPGGDAIAQQADALAALVEARLPLDTQGAQCWRWRGRPLLGPKRAGGMRE
jgi:hypothetical protein